MRTITNKVPRFTLDACDLTAKELKEFDYLPPGEGTFFRYRGQVHDLANFMRLDDPYWHGAEGNSYFSATVVRIVDSERVIVGYQYG